MASDVVVFGNEPEKEKNFVEVVVQPQEARGSLGKDGHGVTQGALDAGW